MSIPAANALISLPLSRGKAAETTSVHHSGECKVARLTRGLAAGDDAAFREFHDQYFDRLYRFLLVVARGQEQEAKDALQQTFLRVVKHARVFEEEDVFWSWLKVVARSAARDGGRKQRRYSLLLQSFAHCLSLNSATPARGDEEELWKTALHESMGELDPEERGLLLAKYVEGLTVREISVERHVTEKAVEARLGRIRQLLRCKMLKRLSQV